MQLLNFGQIPIILILYFDSIHLSNSFIRTIIQSQSEEV